MLFKTAFVLLGAWLLGVFGLYRIGDLCTCSAWLG